MLVLITVEKFGGGSAESARTSLWGAYLSHGGLDLGASSTQVGGIVNLGLSGTPNHGDSRNVAEDGLGVSLS